MTRRDRAALALALCDARTMRDDAWIWVSDYASMIGPAGAVTAARALTLEELRAELAAMEERIVRRVGKRKREPRPPPIPSEERRAIRAKVLRKLAR